jgi:hypothetical protein
VRCVISKNLIGSTIASLGMDTEKMPPIQTIVVGGDSFSALVEKMTDNRIWCFSVDKDTENVFLGNSII